jgi:hypothetical protein
MTAEPDDLPLDGLSETEKDKLIARLWRDLQAERAHSTELASRLAASPRHLDRNTETLTARLSAALSGRDKASDNGGMRSGLARSFAFLQSKTLLFALLALGAGFVLDAAVGQYQTNRLDQRRFAQLQLQHAAFEGLFVEVETVAYEPDGKSFRVKMKFTRIEKGLPLFVMLSPIRVFEQAALDWKEVPSRDPQGGSARVVELTDTYSYECVFEPNAEGWTELIPGYMHVRFESASLVSERSEPDDDIIERTDRYYVYLKPQGADDDSIRRRMNLAGDPPIYMPMPPH